jgi:hypothetical protein
VTATKKYYLQLVVAIVCVHCNSLFNEGLPINAKWEPRGFLKTPASRRSVRDRRSLLYTSRDSCHLTPAFWKSCRFDRSIRSSQRETSTGGSGSNSDSGRSGCRHDDCIVKGSGVTFPSAGFIPLRNWIHAWNTTYVKYDLESCTRIYFILCYQ